MEWLVTLTASMGGGVTLALHCVMGVGKDSRYGA